MLALSCVVGTTIRIPRIAEIAGAEVEVVAEVTREERTAAPFGADTYALPLGICCVMIAFLSWG